MQKCGELVGFSQVRLRIDGWRFCFYSQRMKALLSLVGLLLGMAAYGIGLSTVEINGTTYTNITKAYAGAGGRVIILYEGGGTSATADKLPADFLTSWGVNAEGAKAAQATTAANNLERAIQAGAFREVEGVVYDTRKAQAGWVRFNNVKVLQIVDGDAIVDTTPASYSSVAIHVRHVARTVGDTDYISFTAKPVGNYSYINKVGDDRTIREYDLGRACSRSEIPETVLSGAKAYDTLTGAGESRVDPVASLPESDDLSATGSGFFISEDGYLITNNHVVRNARKVKVKTAGGVFQATVVRTDKAADLALLKVSGQFKALGISTNDARLGDAVFTIGFPSIDLQGAEPKYTDGKISSLAGLRDDPNRYQISVQVQPGNSGGPLVDPAGNVQGVIVSRLDDFAALKSMGAMPQNVNYAIKGKQLRDFVSQSPEVKLAATTMLAGTSSAVATVQEAVAIILVY